MGPVTKKLHRRVFWWKIQKQGMLDAAQHQYDLPLVMRMWTLAVARAYQGGHAEFGPNELLESLQVVDTKTGELSRVTDRTIRSTIEKLVRTNMLSPESNKRCLVVPIDMVDCTAQQVLKPCQAHGHNLSWKIGDGWIDPMELVNDPSVRRRPAAAGDRTWRQEAA
jgi:hypothetical protein